MFMFSVLSPQHKTWSKRWLVGSHPHLLLWVWTGPALPLCHNLGWSLFRQSRKATFLALQRRCTHSKKDYLKLFSFLEKPSLHSAKTTKWIHSNPFKVHAKRPAYWQYHPFFKESLRRLIIWTCPSQKNRICCFFSSCVFWLWVIIV